MNLHQVALWNIMLVEFYTVTSNVEIVLHSFEGGVQKSLTRKLLKLGQIKRGGSD